ncbi:MAG: S41 family peptidase [Parachlamydiales bacterium]|nr:S41 family peptidase [Parachlamydiales bacterium]
MWVRAVFYLLIVILIPNTYAADLRVNDIYEVMDRLFDLHVDKKNLNPTLVQRIYKLYVEQFDAQKIYLLEEEVAPYISLSKGEAKRKLAQLQKGDYSDFHRMDQIFKEAIVRFRRLRQSVGENITGSPTLGYSNYAQSLHELQNRQKNVIGQFLNAKKTVAFDKKKAILERKLLRYEAGYFADAQKESHYFTLRFLRAFSKSLDAHTCFFSPEEAFEMRMNLEKQYQGLGIVLQDSAEGIVIADILKNSPAEKSSKIQKNDLLVGIDDRSLEDASFDEVLNALKKNERDKITLFLKRDSQDVSVELQWAVIEMEEDRLSYSYERVKEGIIGKITLPSFYENDQGVSSEQDMISAIENMEKEGPILGIILDLRDNSGGFLTQAVKVTGLFLSNGVVVISKYSDGEKRLLRTMRQTPRYNGPLIVLTSRLSASASEILAAALQDYGVALIVGDKRTFGKGTIQYQTVTENNPDFFYKVTVGKYYTVSGNTPQMKGVQADIVVPSQYYVYPIGEKYLQYPLPFDQVEAAFNDTLEDLAPIRRLWFHDHYLPYLQKFSSFWIDHRSFLQEQSKNRLEKDEKFQQFLRHQEASEDLQMEEAVNILKDMIDLYSENYSLQAS